MDNRPGYKTTEFYMTIITKIAIVFLTVYGNVDAETAAALMGGTSSVYVAGRSAKKMKVVPQPAEVSQ